jgi:hypothetical protein
MTRRHDGGPYIELLDGRTRLNLPNNPPSAELPKVERRSRRRGLEFTGLGGEHGGHHAEFTCPACGAPGQLDIREGASGRCYLSCTSCFKMWQEVREPDKALQMTSDEEWQLR